MPTVGRSGVPQEGVVGTAFFSAVEAFPASVGSLITGEVGLSVGSAKSVWTAESLVALLGTRLLEVSLIFTSRLASSGDSTTTAFCTREFIISHTKSDNGSSTLS